MIGSDILADIEIAAGYMDTYLPMNGGAKTLYEAYYLPPFGESMFYAKIYRENKLYIADYARTECSDHHGTVSYSRTFASAGKAGSHSGKTGDVICGRRVLDNDIIGRIEDNISLLPDIADNIKKKRVIIDGVTAAIFTYNNGISDKAYEISDRADFPGISLRRRFFEVFSEISGIFGGYRERYTNGR